LRDRCQTEEQLLAAAAELVRSALIAPPDSDSRLAAQDVRHTLSYLDAVRVALARHHRLPSDLPGLGLFDELQSIRDSIARALRPGDEILPELYARLGIFNRQLRTAAAKIRQKLHRVREATEILSNRQKLPSAQVREHIARVVYDLDRAAHGPGRRSPHDRAIYKDMLATATSAAAQRIFACYEHEALRDHRTDNLLENHYGRLRRIERRRTGQRSAARHLTERAGVRAKAIALTRTVDPQKLVAQAADAFVRRGAATSNPAILQPRTPIDQSLRTRRCYARDPDAFLKRLELRE
jgi:hypothetical protein